MSWFGDPSFREPRAPELTEEEHETVADWLGYDTIEESES